jgi:hypothetical protein
MSTTHLLLGRFPRSLSLAAAAVSTFFAFGAVPADAQLSTWSLRAPVQLQVWNDSTSDWDVATNISTTNTQITNGITMVGNGASSTGNKLAFSLTGAEYTALNPGAGQPNSNDHGLRLIGITDGVLLQPYDNAVDRLPTSFDLEVNLAGAGSVNIFNVQSDYGLLDASDNLLQLVGSSGFTQTYTAGNAVSSFGYQDNFGGANANQGTHIVGDFTINLEWSSFSPTDVLEFSLPLNGVTISEIAIPEPASLFLICLPAAALLSRKHRG